MSDGPSVRHDRPTRWLAAAASGYLLVCLAIIATLAVGFGESLSSAVRATGLPVSARLGSAETLADSWEPMLMAYGQSQLVPARSLYRPFFEEGVKFQYPPTALLPLAAMPYEWLTLEPASTSLGVTPSPNFLRVSGRASQGAAWLTIVLSASILATSLRRYGFAPPTTLASATRWVLAVALGVLFYPLVAGHALGQIQVYLTALVAAAIWFELTGRRRLAGICIGVCTLVKPQYALVLVWALYRRRWTEALAISLTAVVGLSVSVAVFGTTVHLEYLDVLRTIGRSGEAFWPNQSLNGVLNRILYNGEITTWMPREYAPYNVIVHALTLASSAIVVAMAVLLPDRTHHAGQTVDLLVILLAATIASPVAWEHHYGILLPVLGAMVPAVLLQRTWGTATGALLLVAYLAVSGAFLRPHLLFVNRWSGLAASHLFFGAALILLLLLSARARRFKP